MRTGFDWRLTLLTGALAVGVVACGGPDEVAGDDTGAVENEIRASRSQAAAMLGAPSNAAFAGISAIPTNAGYSPEGDSSPDPIPARRADAYLPTRAAALDWCDQFEAAFRDRCRGAVLASSEFR